MLADLVHHVRNKLTPTQLSKTVYMYSRNLHDPTLAAGIQTMCSKLLLNLTECIVNIPKRDDKDEGTSGDFISISLKRELTSCILYNSKRIVNKNIGYFCH